MATVCNENPFAHKSDGRPGPKVPDGGRARRSHPEICAKRYENPSNPELILGRGAPVPAYDLLFSNQATESMSARARTQLRTHARTHERTKRNDFPVGNTLPNLRYARGDPHISMCEVVLSKSLSRFDREVDPISSCDQCLRSGFPISVCDQFS